MSDLARQLAFGAAAVTAASGVAGALTYAALSSGSQMFGRTLIAGCDSREIALTYDDGPNDAATGALLDLLAEHEVRATFFMVGRFVRQRPGLVRRVHAAGHLIGNHTETHPWLAWQSGARIREELLGCNQALEDALGVPVRYLRPPHGARRPVVFQIAAELGLTVVQWNAMAKDWQPIGEAAMLANLDRAMQRNQRRGAGSNVLLHDGSDRAMGADRSATLSVTRTLLQREGSRFVTVDAWG